MSYRRFLLVKRHQKCREKRLSSFLPFISFSAFSAVHAHFLPLPMALRERACDISRTLMKSSDSVIVDTLVNGATAGDDSSSASPARVSSAR